MWGPPVVGMNLTQKMFAVCPVVVLTSGLLLCRSHRMMWVSSDPLASSDPVIHTGRRKVARPQKLVQPLPGCSILCMCVFSEPMASSNPAGSRVRWQAWAAEASKVVQSVLQSEFLTKALLLCQQAPPVCLNKKHT